MLFLLYGLIAYVDISDLGMSDAEGGTLKAQLSQSLPYSVAIVHSLFNIVTTLILVGFIPQIEKLVTKMVPSKGNDTEDHRLIFIEKGPLSTAELSLDEARREIQHFGQICTKGYGYLVQAVVEPDQTEFDKLREKLIKYEEITDRVEYEIANYLERISKGEISEMARVRIKAMYKIIGEMESLGDSGEAIGRLIARKFEHGKTFDADMTAKINAMLSCVQHAYDVMMENLENDKLSDITNAYEAEEAINICRDELREEHIANIENRAYDYTSGVYYIDLVCELEKIGDFIINISEAAVQLV